MSRPTFATIARHSSPCRFSPRTTIEQFEIVCYADVAAPDGITQRLRSYADAWRSIVGLDDEQLAQCIREDASISSWT